MTLPKWLVLLGLWLVTCAGVMASSTALAETGPSSMSAVAKAKTDNPGSVQILQTFDQQHQDTADANSAIPQKQKHRILFYLGGALLVLVLLTGSLGIAVGIFDRPWFVWHMISAGLTMTLAVVHAVVAMVWFFPF
jgi:hypothetical protein